MENAFNRYICAIISSTEFNQVQVCLLLQALKNKKEEKCYLHGY